MRHASKRCALVDADATPVRADWAGALASPNWKLLGRLPAYIQGWVLYLAFVAGITSYEFQIAQQLTSIRLILANSKLGTPPGALGDISSVSFGVAVPDHPLPAFQKAFFGIMIGFLAFHALTNFLPIKRINQLAICSFAWLIMISSVVMFALPAITPKRNGADFIFKEWVPATTRPPSSSDTSAAVASTSPPSPAISLMATGTNNGWTAMVGLLMSQYLLLVYDTPSHMAEETHDAARTVPKAIMTSYVLGGFLNIGMLLSYLACMNLDNYQYNGCAPRYGHLAVACSTMLMRALPSLLSHVAGTMRTSASRWPRLTTASPPPTSCTWASPRANVACGPPTIIPNECTPQPRAIRCAVTPTEFCRNGTSLRWRNGSFHATRNTRRSC